MITEQGADFLVCLCQLGVSLLNFNFLFGFSTIVMAGCYLFYWPAQAAGVFLLEVKMLA